MKLAQKQQTTSSHVNIDEHLDASDMDVPSKNDNDNKDAPDLSLGNQRLSIPNEHQIIEGYLWGRDAVFNVKIRPYSLN